LVGGEQVVGASGHEVVVRVGGQEVVRGELVGCGGQVVWGQVVGCRGEELVGDERVVGASGQ
jgi:hypothetical protein